MRQHSAETLAGRMKRIEIGAFSLAKLHADAADDRPGTGATFRARTSRVIGTEVPQRQAPR